MINFNEKDCLKPHLKIKTEPRKKAKNNFEKDFFKLINNAVFIKTMESLRKYRGIKLVATESRRNYLASKPNYQNKMFFTENLLVIEYIVIVRLK